MRDYIIGGLLVIAVLYGGAILIAPAMPSSVRECPVEDEVMLDGECIHVDRIKVIE